MKHTLDRAAAEIAELCRTIEYIYTERLDIRDDIV